ncbi:excalibur calcium-binding domain-containing protein [Streptomyces sp. NPDC060198]|uniref:excalibur calcium-binding domain-containing protein n=1 Tax=Streptomyces sp. NPDC060198 TaxID=3347070 RepID=UPI003665279A
MSFQPPVPPGTNPYTRLSPAPGARPKWTRKRVLFPAAGLLFFVGVGFGASGDPAPGERDAQNASKARPVPTVTVTRTATVTAPPKPAPTVTETLKVTVAPEPAAVGTEEGPGADSDEGTENGTSGSSGTSGTAGTGGAGTGDGAGSAPADTTAYYANCAAVRAAGANPIHRGEPGFGAHLDRDGDGVACE